MYTRIVYLKLQFYPDSYCDRTSGELNGKKNMTPALLRSPNLKTVKLKEGEHPHVCMLCTLAKMRFVRRLSYEI